MLEWRNRRKMVQVERRINQITAILPLSSELPAMAVDAAKGARLARMLVRTAPLCSKADPV